MNKILRALSLIALLLASLSAHAEQYNVVPNVGLLEGQTSGNILGYINGLHQEVDLAGNPLTPGGTSGPFSGNGSVAFPPAGLQISGTNSGIITLASANPTNNYTITFPSASGTLGVLQLAQTWSAAQTFTGGFVVSGSTAGFTSTTAATSATGRYSLAGLATPVAYGTTNSGATQMSTANGVETNGAGTTYDVSLGNSAGTVAFGIPHATTNVVAIGFVKTGGYTVAGLPAGTVGARAYVTDQTAACVAAGAALTGGGAVTCPVFYNGSAWVGD